ncbi:hypothetical protein [Lysinibacillus yapensis]|uniref:hypothetical protein n=1 Tax=Ureibacillus yapensis TaxID=2304605 RepID=UPI001314ECE7|nr:hypothetical protein [Lysinibacillus yapensis]
MIFVWMLAMILVIFVPVFMWKHGVVLSNRGYIGVLIGLCSIGAFSLFGILSGH